MDFTTPYFKMQKDLALSHSSYARVAGIQSEVNKVTVTRVAGSEVQYQKQMNLHRKDMEIMVRNIRKEQKKLRKSVVRYSRKLHEGRRERAKRELEDQIRDKNSKNNMRRISEVYRMQYPQNIQTSPVEDKLTESEDFSRIHQEVEDTENVSDEHVIEGIFGERGEAFEEDEEGGGITLPPISAPAPSVRKTSVSTEEDTLVREPRTLPEITLNPDLETRIRPKRMLKPKKQGVSYSDLIKLQHSTSPKKLFSLVNILAQKHGGKERNVEQEDTSRPTQLGDSLQTEKYKPTGSLTDGSTFKSNGHKLNLDLLESTTDGKDIHVHSAPRNNEKSKQSSARLKSPRSSFLPVIPRQPVEESLEFRKMTQKRGPISWTDAIALIKSVHTLID